MQKLIFIIFFLTSITSCKARLAASPDGPEKVTYKAFTRGREMNIIIQNDSILFLEKSWEGTDSVKQALDKNQKEELKKLISDIKLENLSELSAPSNDRHTDGDWYASVEIARGDEVYKSQDFDKRQPMEELIPLLDFMEKALDKDFM